MLLIRLPRLYTAVLLAVEEEGRTLVVVGLYLARHGACMLLVRHVALVVLSREKIHLGRSSGMQSITFLASD